MVCIDIDVHVDADSDDNDFRDMVIMTTIDNSDNKDAVADADHGFNLAC